MITTYTIRREILNADNDEHAAMGYQVERAESWESAIDKLTEMVNSERKVVTEAALPWVALMAEGHVAGNYFNIFADDSEYGLKFSIATVTR